MQRRARQFIGAIAMLVFAIFYALLVMALLHSRISELPSAVQLTLYAILGFGWIIPLMPLIRWMERSQNSQTQQKR